MAGLAMAGVAAAAAAAGSVFGGTAKQWRASRALVTFTKIRDGDRVGGVTELRAGLDARQMVPSQAFKQPRAAGQFAATLAPGPVINKTPTWHLTWRLAYSGLSGPAIAAHIHAGTRGRNGYAAFTLCEPCKSPRRGAVALPILADERKQFLKGGYYVEVHTPKNEYGEIRGQILPIH